jgi:DNA invertase Pin-like site-specific DNA recombinase
MGAMNTAPITAGVYLRISSDPKDKKLGIARQREDCLKLCAEKGWEPVEYVDNDISAASGKTRPAYERMLADIESAALGAVVAWDLDRLHRRPIELERFMTLADTHRIALATVSGDVDLSTPQGRLIARLKGDVAAHEIEQMKARMLRAARQKAESGKPQWKRAFGYLPDTRRKDDDDGTRKVNPAQRKLVNKAYSMILAQAKLSEICALFNDANAYGLGGKPWTPSTVSLFLRSPRNAGLRDHNGQIVLDDHGEPVKGTWPPLVSVDTWRAAQTVLNAPSRAPGPKTVRQHKLTGILRCGKPGCGGHLSGMQTIDNKRITYACKTCRGVSVRAEHVEPVVEARLIAELSKPSARKLVQKQLTPSQRIAIDTERIAMQEKLRDMGVRELKGLVSPEAHHAATVYANQRKAELDAIELDDLRVRVFKGLKIGSPEVVDGWDAITTDRLRAMLDIVFVITVGPVGKGGHTFRRDRVHFARK